MPENISGVFFANQILTSKGLGAFGSAAMSDGILDGCSVTVNGEKSLTIHPGHILIKGRVFTVEGDITIRNWSTSGAHTVLYATADLTQAATASAFEQVSFSAYSGDSFNAATAQGYYGEDINMTGEKYAAWVCYLDSSGATPVVKAYQWACARGFGLMWENPAPDNAEGFAAQTLFLPLLNSFNAVTISYALSCDSSVPYYEYRQSLVCPYKTPRSWNGTQTGVDDNTEFKFSLAFPEVNNDANHTILIRDRAVIIKPALGTIAFRDAYVSGEVSSDNTSVIPLAIYGMNWW